MFDGRYVVDEFSLVLKALFLLTGYVVVLISQHRDRGGRLLPGRVLRAAALQRARHGDDGVEPATWSASSSPSSSCRSPPTCWPRGASATRKSNEAGVKYYLLGVFASAVHALRHEPAVRRDRHHGSPSIGEARRATTLDGLDVLAIVFVIVGFAFKVSAVPFHTWAPDTYQGAPTPITAFLSVASKAAGFVALITRDLRRLPDGRRRVGSRSSGCSPALTMTVGNLLALRQTNIVRMLAYSSDQPGWLHPDAAGGRRATPAPSRAQGRRRLPPRLRGHEPRRLRRRDRRGPQDAQRRDLAATAACSATPPAWP